ncbi:MAG: hypothetical protein L6Q33_12120 [Bacteriovoracaceae bacterium]|nr:hypothetical protein [Bacteriovoracaceae bacterium]
MKRTFFFLLITLFFNQTVLAKQIDKIALVVNDTSFTLSQIKRIQDSINVDYVEDQIKGNEKKLGVNRQALLQFLNQQGFNFDEYFETIREAIEYSIFIQRVISPIVSITDQEVKNTYFKQNSKNARMNFKYGLIDYSINKDIAAGTKFLSAIKDFKKSNIIAEDFKDYSATNLDALTEEDISAELNAILKETDEGAITKPIMIGGKLHVFYVAKKDLVESSEYLKEKEKIRNQLFEKAVVLETKDWLIRERNKHFIKNNL